MINTVRNSRSTLQQSLHTYLINTHPSINHGRQEVSPRRSQRPPLHLQLEQRIHHFRREDQGAGRLHHQTHPIGIQRPGKSSSISPVGRAIKSELPAFPPSLPSKHMKTLENRNHKPLSYTYILTLLTISNQHNLTSNPPLVRPRPNPARVPALEVLDHRRHCHPGRRPQGGVRGPHETTVGGLQGRVWMCVVLRGRRELDGPAAEESHGGGTGAGVVGSFEWDGEFWPKFEASALSV